MTTPLTLETIRQAPKALLHDHLDGGLRPATVLRSHVSLAVSAPHARAAGRLNIFTDADGQHLFALCKQRGSSLTAPQKCRGAWVERGLGHLLGCTPPTVPWVQTGGAPACGDPKVKSVQSLGLLRVWQSQASIFDRV